MIKLIDINKEEDYDAWLNFRTSGIGASEVGTILGLNPYKSATELFYQKIGKLPQKIDENIAMFMGNRMEPLVADLWEYYDDEESQMIENFNTGKKTRMCGEIIGYLVNDKYPHLFLSPDRLIYNDSKKALYSVSSKGVNLKNVRGVLEIKTISSFASKQWEGGVPPSYVVQLMTYMIGLEKKYGEIVFLEDGRKLTVIPVEYNQSIADQIIEKTTEFWDRVTCALKDMDNCELYEPEPDGTPAYETFLDKRYTSSIDKIYVEGSESHYELAVRHKQLTEQLKDLEYEARECSNTLKNIIGEAEGIDFKEMGKVTWKSTVKGNRLFKNSIKLT